MVVEPVRLLEPAINDKLGEPWNLIAEGASNLVEVVVGPVILDLDFVCLVVHLELEQVKDLTQVGIAQD